MKFTEQIIQEAIELSKAKPYVKGWDKNRLKDWFDGKYRVYLDLEKGIPASKDIESELEKEIKDSLSDTDYEVKDFKKGMAYDKKNKREIKLGKVLGKIDKELLQRFVNDPGRTSSKVTKPIVVISRHPYDIAGQSYKRGWTSCKDFSGNRGGNKGYIKDETRLSLIAYLIYKDDKNIKTPIARVLISQFKNEQKEIYYGVQMKTYGSAGVWEGALFRTIQKWLDEKQGRKFGKFKFNTKQYQDTAESEIYLAKDGEYPDWIIKAKNFAKEFSYDDSKPNSFVWKRGQWRRGTWVNGTWEAGTWYDGIWENGTWLGGAWRGGRWENGTWRGGVFFDGEWMKGRWGGGTWYRGEWRDGKWEDGNWQGGTWIKGTWEGGTWFSGVWMNGTWKGGVWHKGGWKKGTWEDGTWENGVWEDGKWKNGIWEDGVWKRGWIYDPDKQGNFEDDWKWKNNYVRSPIDPQEYFFARRRKKSKKTTSK